MIRRVLAIALAATLALAAFAVLTAPTEISGLPDTPELLGISEDPAGWLDRAETRVSAVTPIIDGAEKRIRWHADASGRPTGYAVVYLHGFSATRQEVAPVAEMVADGLQANLFETRLKGHGLESDALTGARAEDWLADGLESLAMGRALGERIVLMGTSTGATLALALVEHELFEYVDTLVMLSPNFAPRDDTAELLTRPGGPQIARLMLGETRSWEPANDLQARYWSTSYPTDALVEMMRLVNYARARLPAEVSSGVLTFYSPRDQVVDIGRIEQSLPNIVSPRAETVVVESSGDPSNHVLAGNILAPENNERLAARVIDFVKKGTL